MTRTTILGVRFLCGTPAEAVDAGIRGGLVVVPSAPVLVRMEEDPSLLASVLGADLAITDSGLMVLLWRLLKRERLERVSGLEYLKLLLQKLNAECGMRNAEGTDRISTGNSQVSHVARSGVFWVMPTVAARDQNLAWLQSQGHQTTIDDCYVAPIYPADGELSDGRLLEIILTRRPAHVILALGGGVQERLGFALKLGLEKAESKKLKAEGFDSSTESASLAFGVAYRPGFHCVGAAIGFLSGEQVNIPPWADYLYLGWLFRSLSEPVKFIPRYWKAKRLVWLMIRYRDKAPVVALPRATG